MFTSHTLLSTSFFAALLVNVEGSDCGKTYCTGNEVCETSVDGGTCYNRSSRIDCSDGISYCYKPRKCCGISTCCPAHSECCGFNTCCPEGAVCCSPNYCCEKGTTCCGYEQCCAAGSHCDGGICKANSGGPFRWWYIFFFLAPLITIIGVIVRRRRRAALLRASGTQGIIVAVPVQNRTDQYSYDQGPISYELPQADNAERPSGTHGPPPAYNEVVNPQA